MSRVCALPAKAFQKKVEFAILDASCASENILLAIEALGLGGVWTEAYPDVDKMIHVRKVLGIPGDVIPLNVIPVGHPVGTDKPKDKFKPENIHLSMEKNMSCGIGKCGHCRIGPYYACKDGPVFTYDKLKELPNIWD